MSLRNAMFGGLIAFRPIHRTERALASHAAFQLLSHFLRASLLQRIGAAAHSQRAGDHKPDRYALHRPILGSDTGIASIVARWPRRTLLHNFVSHDRAGTSSASLSARHFPDGHGGRIHCLVLAST